MVINFNLESGISGAFVGATINSLNQVRYFSIFIVFIFINNNNIRIINNRKKIVFQ